ncbi:hypothetical protein APHAL10511_004474 [Amanita phalloides]|nr:hypothetical protein APHAL10511_004474 [Amanita phalloides]
MVDATRQFLDLEAQHNDYSKADSEDGESFLNDNFLDDTTRPMTSSTSSGPLRQVISEAPSDTHLAGVITHYENDINSLMSTSVASTHGLQNRLSDMHLAVVIARYEAHRIREESEGEQSPMDGEGNEDNTEDIDKIVGAAWSSLMCDDNPLWRVRVKVSRNDHSPCLAQIISEGRFIYKPMKPLWILIEANSHTVVHEACLNLSTFPHPLDIAPIPAEQHHEWVNWGSKQPQEALVDSPRWCRLWKGALLKKKKIAPLVRRYAGNLALLCNTEQWPMVKICLIPWLQHAMKVFDELVEGEY